MRKPVKDRLRLLRLGQGNRKIDQFRIERQMRSEYPSVDYVDNNFRLIFSGVDAADWCQEMLPRTQWEPIGTTFLFTTNEQKDWFKLRWIGTDDEEGE